MPTKSQSIKQRLYSIIFESDTAKGKLFDRTIIGLILISLLVVILDSVESISKRFDYFFTALEWTFTILFTIEYVARLYCAPQRLKYAFSFYGLIDLLSVIPTYLALLFPELHSLLDIRVLRLIRVFRIFKLTEYYSEYKDLTMAISASKKKIFVFLSLVSMAVLVMGTLMYVVEGAENGYTSIPVGIYWAITTMTTVGFGDITPKTDLGRFLSSIMMLLGWGVLAVPTGIVTAEMATAKKSPGTASSPNRICQDCGNKKLDATDHFCRDCGAMLIREVK